MSPTHRISFVITTRNDDFGGEMLRRLFLFVDTLLPQCERHGLDAELIIVEWNPPPGPRLHDVLRSRTLSKAVPIRFIEVPPELHETFRNCDVLPLFQMIAKNVGIRRARGDFVLATNQDILLSDALVAFLAQGELDPQTMYRIDRHDVEADLPADLPLDQRLDWCERHILRVHSRRGTFPRVRRLVGSNLPAAARELVRHYPPQRAIAAALRAPVRRLIADTVHTNACGDFTLCARERWLALRGYAEIPIYSLHIDSLFCYAAIASGLRQRILRRPNRIYHLEHASSWAVMSPEEKLRWFATKPWLDTSVLSESWDHMRMSGRPLLINPESWGLGDRVLPETTLAEGRSA